MIIIANVKLYQKPFMFENVAAIPLKESESPKPAKVKGKNINATIGTALKADGSPLCLASIKNMIDIAPASAFLYAPSYIPGPASGSVQTS